MTLCRHSLSFLPILLLLYFLQCCKASFAKNITLPKITRGSLLLLRFQQSPSLSVKKYIQIIYQFFSTALYYIFFSLQNFKHPPLLLLLLSLSFFVYIYIYLEHSLIYTTSSPNSVQKEDKEDS